jgi:hypothetical protein
MNGERSGAHISFDKKHKQTECEIITDMPLRSVRTENEYQWGTRLRKAPLGWACRRFANSNNCKQYWWQDNCQGNPKHLGERGGHYFVSYWLQQAHMDCSKIWTRGSVMPLSQFKSQQPNSRNYRNVSSWTAWPFKWDRCRPETSVNNYSIQHPKTA